MSHEKRKGEERTLRAEARLAKVRLKNGFWSECKEDMQETLQRARLLGVNESKAGRYFATQVSKKIAGEKEDEFYLKVKEMLLHAGNVTEGFFMEKILR